MVIVAVLVLLTLFSIVSIVMSAQEPRSLGDPNGDPELWAALNRL